MRGEWIEMNCSAVRVPMLSLSPCGESGLKWAAVVQSHQSRGLSPCGESGLKLVAPLIVAISLKSLPMRGEWIEISATASFWARRRGLSPCGESGLKSAL